MPIKRTNRLARYKARMDEDARSLRTLLIAGAIVETFPVWGTLAFYLLYVWKYWLARMDENPYRAPQTRDMLPPAAPPELLPWAVAMTAAIAVVLSYLAMLLLD